MLSRRGCGSAWNVEGWNVLTNKLRLREMGLGYSLLTARRKASFASGCMLRHIRLSVRHTPVLCQNEGTQTDAVFAVCI